MRTIILASDDSEMINNYPNVSWAWNQLGYNTHLFFLGKDSALLEVFKKVKDHFQPSKNQITRLPQIQGYENDVVLSAAKLFGGFCYWKNEMLMTSDMDIIPIRDYWSIENGMRYADKSISRFLALSAGEWRLKMETKNTTTLDEELKLLLDSNIEFKDKEPVNRTIAMNNIIIEKLIDKDIVLDYAPTNSFYTLPETCQTNSTNLIKTILLENYNKLPKWLS